MSRVYISEYCPKCDAENFYYDTSKYTVEGLICWKCKHEWIFDIFEGLISPESAFIEEGAKTIKEII